MWWIVSEIQKIADFFKMAPPNGDWPKRNISKLEMLSSSRRITYLNYLEIIFLWNYCNRCVIIWLTTYVPGYLSYWRVCGKIWALATLSPPLRNRDIKLANLLSTAKSLDTIWIFSTRWTAKSTSALHLLFWFSGKGKQITSEQLHCQITNPTRHCIHDYDCICGDILH